MQHPLMSSSAVTPGLAAMAFASFMLASMALAGPASAQEEDPVEALRQELEAMRQDYEKRIAELEARLAELEAQSQADELAEIRRAAEAAAAEAAATPTTDAVVGPTVGHERNLNRLNPEISITGIVLANSADPGRNEIQAQEFELDLQAALDPYSRTRVTLAVREEGVEIEEGYVSYNSLPGSLQLTVGKFRQRWGLLNRQHRHALPQSDYPLAYQSFFGEEGLAQTGLSFDWLLPKLWASSNELSIEVTNGENDVAFAGEFFEDFSFLGRFNNYWDLNAASYFEWGLSGIFGKTADDADSLVYGTDFAYSWSPPSRAKYRGVNWRAEILWSQKDDEFGEQQDAWGAFTYLEGLLARNFYLGARLDRAGDPLIPGDYKWGVLPYLTWWQSEYVRLRGEYGYYVLEPLGESENRFTLQLTWAAGPHKHATY
jgi:hypothetical protein